MARPKKNNFVAASISQSLKLEKEMVDIYGFLPRLPITVLYVVILRLQLEIYGMVDNDNKWNEIHIKLQFRPSVEAK